MYLNHTTRMKEKRKRNWFITHEEGKCPKERIQIDEIKRFAEYSSKTDR